MKPGYKPIIRDRVLVLAMILVAIAFACIALSPQPVNVITIKHLAPKPAHHVINPWLAKKHHSRKSRYA